MKKKPTPAQIVEKKREKKIEQQINKKAQEKNKRMLQFQNYNKKIARQSRRIEGRGASTIPVPPQFSYYVLYHSNCKFMCHDMPTLLPPWLYSIIFWSQRQKRMGWCDYYYRPRGGANYQCHIHGFCCPSSLSGT